MSVLVEEPVRSYTMVPLVSPTANGTQMFVNHPQVSAQAREDLAHFLVQQRDIVEVSTAEAEPILREIERLAGVQLGETLSRLAAGLPIYEARFGRRGTFHVTACGHVGGPREGA